MSHWRTLQQSLLRETDRSRVERLVYEMEEAIFVRCRKLANDRSESSELREIKNAIDALYDVKVRKLGWPDPIAAARGFDPFREA